MIFRPTNSNASCSTSLMLPLLHVACTITLMLPWLLLIHLLTVMIYEEALKFVSYMYGVAMIQNYLLCCPLPCFSFPIFLTHHSTHCQSKARFEHEGDGYSAVYYSVLRNTSCFRFYFCSCGFMTSPASRTIHSVCITPAHAVYCQLFVLLTHLVAGQYMDVKPYD